MESLSTEDKIISAARSVFLVHGKEGARMQDIADKAGINKALLHYYYRSKDHLFQKVFRAEITQLVEQIIAAIDDAHDFYGFLENFVGTYVGAVSMRKNMLRFILWESDKNQMQFSQYFLEEIDRHGFDRNPILARIQDAVDTGRIRPVEPAHLLISIIGMCLFPILASDIMRQLLPELDFEDHSFTEKRVQNIVDVVWQGIRPVATEGSAR